METLSDVLLAGRGLGITEAVYRGIRCEYYKERGGRSASEMKGICCRPIRRAGQPLTTSMISWSQSTALSI